MPSEDTRFGGLIDAERRHQTSPDSFSIPRSDVRAALQAGDLVKLLFAIGFDEDAAAERMWVEVTERRPEGYVGRLENEPEVISDLSRGAPVMFGAEHVAATWREAPDAPRPSQLAIVSQRIVREGQPPVRALRAPAPSDEHSGWIVFAAADPPLPPPDLSGFDLVGHGELSDRHRSFDSIEDEPPGTHWRWDADALEWRADAEAGRD